MRSRWILAMVAAVALMSAVAFRPAASALDTPLYQLEGETDAQMIERLTDAVRASGADGVACYVNGTYAGGTYHWSEETVFYGGDAIPDHEGQWWPGTWYWHGHEGAFCWLALELMDAGMDEAEIMRLARAQYAENGWIWPE